MALNKKPEVLSRGVEDGCLLCESLLHHADARSQVNMEYKTVSN